MAGVNTKMSYQITLAWNLRTCDFRVVNRLSKKLKLLQLKQVRKKTLRYAYENTFVLVSAHGLEVIQILFTKK